MIINLIVITGLLLQIEKGLNEGTNQHQSDTLLNSRSSEESQILKDMKIKSGRRSSADYTQ